MFIASDPIGALIVIAIIIYFGGLMLTWKMLSEVYQYSDRIPWHIRFLPLFSFVGIAIFFVGLIVFLIGWALCLLVTGKHWGETE